MKCWDCKKEIDDNDNYCRHCGMGQGGHTPFSYRLPGVMLWFFFIGPFAIYFAVRSPFLSRNAKIVISVVMTVLFLWFCVGVYNTVSIAFEEAQKLLESGMMPI